MDWLWIQDEFLGIDWHVWKVIGWVGNLAFFSRFMVQWYASEKEHRVVVPVAFWWLSLVGSLLLLTYAFYQKDSVFIFAYIFTWIPYVRNLMLHHREAALSSVCPACGKVSAGAAFYCGACGVRLKPLEEGAAASPAGGASAAEGGGGPDRDQEGK